MSIADEAVKLGISVLEMQTREITRLESELTEARDVGEGFRQELLQSVADRRCELLAHEAELATEKARLRMAIDVVEAKWGTDLMVWLNDECVRRLRQQEAGT